MEINREYKGFVKDILTRQQNNTSGIHLFFEDIDVYLEPREFYLVCYAIARHRPTNRTINKILFDFIRGYDMVEVPEFIFNWSRQNSMIINFSNTWEETYYKRSIATSGPNNPSYKGTIFAVNIETDDIIALNSITDMKAHGFLPSGVYECVNGNCYTHKGHVFIRERDLIKPRTFQRKKLGLT